MEVPVITSHSEGYGTGEREREKGEGSHHIHMSYTAAECSSERGSLCVSRSAIGTIAPFSSNRQFLFIVSKTLCLFHIIIIMIALLA